MMSGRLPLETTQHPCARIGKSEKRESRVAAAALDATAIGTSQTVQEIASRIPCD